MKYFYLTISIIIFSRLTISGQADMTSVASEHYFSAEVSKDYILYKYESSNSGNHEGYRYIHLYAASNRMPNYSICLNYGYNLRKWLFLSCGLGFSNQHYYVARYNEPVLILDTLTYAYVYDYRVKYLSVPIGLKCSFAQRFFIRPYIKLELSNSFSFSERIREVTAVRDVYNSYYSEKWHYYMLRGQISVGIDYIIRKHYVIGMDVTYKSRPWLHPDKGMITRCWYSNINIGGHVGYSF